VLKNGLEFKWYPRSATGSFQPFTVLSELLNYGKFDVLHKKLIFGQASALNA